MSVITITIIVNVVLLLYAAAAMQRNTPIELSSLCRSFPRASFLQAQQVDLICDHYAHWHRDRDSDENNIHDISYTQKRYLNDLERCTRSDCTARHNGRQKRANQKNVRKEIRMMTPQERERLFKAMNMLKSRTIDNITAWDLHTLVHYPNSAPGAHWGPAFLPWHREFLRQFEIALQKEVPGVALGYWDSTLDQGLPDPADSVLWSEALLGNGNGYVKSGPFREWHTNVNMPLSQVPVNRLYRMTGGRVQDRLMSPKDVAWIMSREKFDDLVFCHDSTFESLHGLSHAWVGGFMFVIRVSPNDPAFYMHHAFIDNLWEQWRHRHQTRWQRENQWSENPCSKLQEAYQQMRPFSMLNRDGLSNNYTDNWYEYDPVAHCTSSRPYCDSPYLWCDAKANRCRAKVVRGGNCTSFEGTSICFESICQKGKCTLPPEITPTREVLVKEANLPPAILSPPVVNWRPPPPKRRRPSETVWAKTIFVDQNAYPLRDTLASITVIDKPGNENFTAYLEPLAEYPEIPGIVYMPLLKPHIDITHTFSLEARDGSGRLCQAQCYNDSLERYQVCDPTLTVASRPDASSPISYTHSIMTRRFLDTDLTVHPLRVHPSVPFIVFACTTKVLTSAQVAAVGDSYRARAPSSPMIWFRVAVHAADTRGMQIEVTQLDEWREPWIAAIATASSPFDPSIVFAQAPNPEFSPTGLVRLAVSIYENGERTTCLAKCTMDDGSVRTCEGELELSIDPNRGDEPVWTGDESSLSVLGWDMRGHPTRWRHRMPFLTLIC